MIEHLTRLMVQSGAGWVLWLLFGAERGVDRDRHRTGLGISPLRGRRRTPGAQIAPTAALTTRRRPPSF